MTRLAIALALALLSAGSPQAPTPAVRLHHLHYRVGDPASAMNHVSAATGGARTILQGFGVGVRAGDLYALFDRLDASPTSPNAPAEAYVRARAWLAGHGVSAPEPFPAAALASAAGDEALDHLGFVSDDLDALRDHLRMRGAVVSASRDDAFRVVVDRNLTLEFVKPTGGEEAFWCPMHPDVRAAVAGACPLCGMELTPIPPPRLGEYRMDVELTPAPGGRGASAVRLTIRDPQTGEPVPSFAVVHERPFHLFIVSQSLEYFEHVHPEPAGEGRFVLRHAIPPGVYMLIADFLPQGGYPQTLQRAIVTPGFDRPIVAMAPAPAPGPAERVVDGVRFAIDARDVRARRDATLRFTLTDAETGRPVTDLEPYLGAPAHMLLVRTDLTEAVHGHPEELATGGPVVTFDPLMPAAGHYKLWLQVQRRGRVITAPFVIEVEER